ncbi:threonine-phosphate decarboxylase CobD [uncultured Reyranella sp.]|uniref:threonine-phosphate decarboxylase CobD n=1 Tax=uncultured Reyranella sp. TaxID=735512 RepID=UPI00259D2074|nr:threonine-phosphate decarboxylase CobD [uncultured Reyranella sp.]
MSALPNMANPAGKPVEHGGDLSAVRRRFPDAPLPWLDLSTGINPVPYPVPDLPRDAWARLPAREQAEALIDAAAHRYGVADRSTLVAAPGTQALIQALPRLVPKARVCIVGPTYEEHETCWRRQGHEVSVVATLDDARDADVVVLVNPNNPDGRLVPVERLVAAARLLVVDEAFIDLLPAAASLAPTLPPRTVVLRSFGKTYGLAGVRLGFAIAGPDIAAALRADLGPWAVSGPALEIGRVALADDAWLAATAERLTADRRRLDEILVSAGFTIVGGTPLFCLADHPEAASTVDRLGRNGIHVRAFRQSPRRLRFGLPGDAASFDRLRTSLT